jgi:hypothetical protein
MSCAKLRVAFFMASAITMLVLSASATALASPPTNVLSGELRAGGAPDVEGVFTLQANVTVAGHSASGTLDLSGRIFPGGQQRAFEGEATCAHWHGNRLTIGAFGAGFTEQLHLVEGKLVFREQLPGTYALVETFIFGHFTGSTFGNPHPFPLTHEIEPLYQDHPEGVPSSVPPSCEGVHKHQRPERGAFEGNVRDTLTVSPSITRPRDGAHGFRTVPLEGRAEPNTAIDVLEVGDEAGATAVAVGANGRWSLELQGLAPGSHEFTAKAEEGSLVPANTVRFRTR